MASIGEITVDVHVTDQSIHDLFKELAEKIYDKTDIIIQDVSFGWDTFGFGTPHHLFQVKINSSK